MQAVCPIFLPSFSCYKSGLLFLFDTFIPQPLPFWQQVAGFYNKPFCYQQVCYAVELKTQHHAGVYKQGARIEFAMEMNG